MITVKRYGISVHVDMTCNECGEFESVRRNTYNKAMDYMQSRNDLYCNIHTGYYCCHDCMITLPWADWLHNLKLKVERYATYRTNA